MITSNISFIAMKQIPVSSESIPVQYFSWNCQDSNEMYSRVKTRHSLINRKSCLLLVGEFSVTTHYGKFRFPSMNVL